LSVQEKANVTGIGRNLEKAGWLRDSGVELTQADLLDNNALKRAVQGKELIFHAAAAMDADPKTAEAVNVDASEKLAEFATEAGARRFVHVSTVGVYDMSAGPDDVNESTPLATDHPGTYPRTKAQAEQRLFGVSGKTELEITAVRPSMVYGPGPGVWTVMMFNNVKKGDPVFLGDGSFWFNPVYIDDVVDLLIRCAKSPNAPGEAFNASADVSTWREFMGYYGTLSGNEPKGMPLWLARAMVFANKIPGIRTPIDEGFLEMSTSRKRFPTDKADRLLGWKPATSLDEGMEKTTRWLTEQGFVD
jgi:nucleoside-diphosphate-sugar epimerase